jgi:hypothetical protein
MENVIKFETDPRMIELLESIDRKLDLMLGDGAERMYSLKEAALALGMSYQQAREYADRGEIRYVDNGNGGQRVRYAIPASAIEEFKTARTKGREAL